MSTKPPVEVPTLSAEAKAAIPEILAFLEAKKPTFRYKTAATAMDIAASVLTREIETDEDDDEPEEGS